MSPEVEVILTSPDGIMQAPTQPQRPGLSPPDKRTQSFGETTGPLPPPLGTPSA